ncbi:unnamed protein product [Heligmosomoides polygyrus]|uniref:MARVEL domain-containing protein n=1 Tax=Heligmosomoides polygyrus TaxID=6339 RepID=A0A3P7XEA5_HELPZ|nr:unnamed protein product [Heligmosomoides polygyrus]
MNDAGPARLLAVYGGTTFLVYLETDGFTKSSWEVMVLGYALVTIANLLYFYSFQHLIEEWSIAMTMFTTMFYTSLAYYCFADLFVSIPFLVFLHLCSLGSSCLLVVAAGSVCLNNLETDYETYQLGGIIDCAQHGRFLNPTILERQDYS